MPCCRVTPNADQCPHKMRVPFVRRDGALNHGMKPSGISSMLSAEGEFHFAFGGAYSQAGQGVDDDPQARRSRQVVAPFGGGCRRTCPRQNPASRRRAMRLPTSAARASVVSVSHIGSTPAWTMREPFSACASGRFRSQSHRAAPSVAAKTSPNVSRLRSWPSLAWAASRCKS